VMVRWLGILAGTLRSLVRTHRELALETWRSAATCRVEGQPTTTAAERHGPNVLGSAVETIEEVAAFVAGGPAGDGGWLAPASVSTLLGLEESATFRSTRDQCGPSGPDSANELRQSSLSLAKDPP